MQNENQNRINTVFKTTFENINNLIDVNTIMGKPIKTDDGEIIIPISKVTFGLLSGGGEYGKIGIFKSETDLPYSVGNGSIVSVKPCGFLIKEKNKAYKMVYAEKDGYEKLLDKAIETLNKITGDN